MQKTTTKFFNIKPGNNEIKIRGFKEVLEVKDDGQPSILIRHDPDTKGETLLKIQALRPGVPLEDGLKYIGMCKFRTDPYLVFEKLDTSKQLVGNISDLPEKTNPEPGDNVDITDDTKEDKKGKKKK